jgi:flagellar biosynthesis protein FlhF
MRRDVTRRVFRGRELALVAAQARRTFGDDAVILGTRVLRGAGGSTVEVIAAAAGDVERFRDRLTPERPASSGRRTVVALVGPTGAGKTTTLAKLALHAEGFGRGQAGFVSLDTYRAGAVGQLEAYADVAALPLEVAYDAADAPGALARLAACDVVLVDTPGRGPRTDAAEGGLAWVEALVALAPDEIHLVLPASIRPELAELARERFDALLSAAPAPTGEATGGARPVARGVTHLLLTKLDEVPHDDGVSDLAARLGLPVRWVTEGQEIPRDLTPGVPRLLAALGTFGGDVGVMPVTFDRPADAAPRGAAATPPR